MLDMGFIDPVRRIVKTIPARRQTMMFSATMPPAILALANEILVEPTRIAVAPPATAVAGVTQVAHPVDHAHKRALLVHLLRTGGMRRTIVFTRTKHGASRLADHLSRSGQIAVALHGDKTQSARIRALRDFKSGAAWVLVATDLASRGIDVEGVTHVVNFDLPNTHEDYIHRIGRTARAQATGSAVSFVSELEGEQWREIERAASPAIPQTVIAGFEPKAGRNTTTTQTPGGRNTSQSRGHRAGRGRGWR
jgi:ATP-dependent RNA helicase RhlE